ncbi:MAG TPA: hypothetical protein VH350_07360 [Candidatus Sulfotelmatobacter sp.]|nr:hypothetical protein [Candidatus Sulfotelmatobacter sp.]
MASLRLSFPLRTWSKDSSCHADPNLPLSLLMLRAEAPLMACRISGRAKVQPSESRRAEKQVCVIRHDYSGMEVDCFALVVEAMLQG